MPPPRPSRRDAKGDWQRWAYDELIAAKPQPGAGVLTNILSETHRRLLKQRAKDFKESPPECALPILDNQYFHFGLWYDLAGELHLWNTTRVEHSGKSWARFTNPYIGGFHAGVPNSPYCGYKILNSNTGNVSVSACLSDADAETSIGPFILDARPGQPAGVFTIDYGQYVDFLIYPAKRNSGRFMFTFANYPPETPIVYASGLGYYVYDGGSPTPIFGPWPLPY